MKKFALLGVMALFMASSAFAGEYEPIKVACQFEGAVKKTAVECKAFALIFKREHNGGPVNSLERPENRLKVVCDGQKVYEGEADVDYDHFDHTLTISANEPGPLPEIIISKGMGPAPTDHEGRVKTSWLRVDGVQLPGFCKLRKADRED